MSDTTSHGNDETQPVRQNFTMPYHKDEGYDMPEGVHGTCDTCGKSYTSTGRELTEHPTIRRSGDTTRSGWEMPCVLTVECPGTIFIPDTADGIQMK